MTIRLVNNYDSGGTARAKWNQDIVELEGMITTPYTVEVMDSKTIHYTQAGTLSQISEIQGNVKLSADTGNALHINDDGLYLSLPDGSTPIVTTIVDQSGLKTYLNVRAGQDGSAYISTGDSNLTINDATLLSQLYQDEPALIGKMADVTYAPKSGLYPQDHINLIGYISGGNYTAGATGANFDCYFPLQLRLYHNGDLYADNLAPMVKAHSVGDVTLPNGTVYNYPTTAETLLSADGHFCPLIDVAAGASTVWRYK